MAKDLPIVELHEKEADEYARWISISSDLAYAVEAAKRLQTRIEKSKVELALLPPEEFVEWQALWVAALIAYFRSFSTTGRRRSLDPSIFSNFVDGAVDAHGFFHRLRDKHVAHPVDPHEQTKIGLLLEPPENADKKVIGIAELSLSRTFERGSNLEIFVRLAEYAKSYVDEKVTRVRGSLFEHAQTLPVDELYLRRHVTLTAKGTPQPATKQLDQERMTISEEGTGSLAWILHVYG